MNRRPAALGQLQADLDFALDRSTITHDASPIDWPELRGPELLGWIAKTEPPKRPVTERDVCPLDWRLVLIGPPLMRSLVAVPDLEPVD